jgi:hypothetical protein
VPCCVEAATLLIRKQPAPAGSYEQLPTSVEEGTAHGAEAGQVEAGQAEAGQAEAGQAEAGQAALGGLAAAMQGIGGGAEPFAARHRDYVSAGVAAGIAAAFGAPLGGVLFSQEEACTHWSRRVAWHCFVASAVATFVHTRLSPECAAARCQQPGGARGLVSCGRRPPLARSGPGPGQRDSHSLCAATPAGPQVGGRYAFHPVGGPARKPGVPPGAAAAGVAQRRSGCPPCHVQLLPPPGAAA